MRIQNKKIDGEIQKSLQHFNLKRISLGEESILFMVGLVQLPPLVCQRISANDR